MRDRCVVTAAFREPYTLHNEKQMEVLQGECFDLNIIRFIDCLPYKEGLIKENVVSRFQKSVYGFKPHAIQHAIEQGCKSVIWFDPSVLPITPIIDLFNELETTDMLIIPGEHPIKEMTSDKAFAWFGLENTININHIGGTFYGFNFNNPKTVACFELWKKAEEEGIFGNQDEFMAGHWADESCMALAMYKCGIEQKHSECFKYLNQKNL